MERDATSPIAETSQQMARRQIFQMTPPRPVLEKAPGRYLSFPFVTALANDELLVTYREAEAAPNTWSHGHNGVLKALRWTAGKWSRPTLLHQAAPPAEVMDGQTSRLPGGAIHLFIRTYLGRRNNANSSLVYACRSSDEGRTFSTPHGPIVLPEFPNSWVNFGKIIALSGGELLVGAYNRRPGEGSSAACLVSDDDARTWHFRSWIARSGHPPEIPNFHEPYMLRLRDGSLFAMLRTNGTFYAARSSDNGLTWSPPQPQFKGMACAGLVLSTGAILVTFRGIHDVSNAADGNRPATFPKPGRLYNYRVSTDNGRTWSPETEIDAHTAYQVGSYGMGDCVENPDGSVRIIYYTSDDSQTPWLEERTLLPAQ